ncbi:hypothetical protein KJS94_08150 [Flavihumibacter rivuli]|uniref:SO2930 family diheme c-type cytochrome n=1 Tax=Flavihumibacter rivuli TaxID=2838156 RepID=UPI001BDF40DA|nr:SO2930 family diheme c-type cytochrome [Flavihumibacter rivuli]ULQ58166.1 hypothetical protein KJS94_08150 [Flavihumibacter rivuli]
MRKLLTVSALVLVILAGVSFTRKPVQSFEKKEKLSDYGFFLGPLADLTPREDVIPYHLVTPLFSNYAEKSRFIVVPRGEKAEYNGEGVFNLPTGTVLIKNFYYPNDFRDPAKGRRIIETRILVHETDGWKAYPYIWNDEQTDAFYDVTGDTKSINYIDHRGKKVQTSYVIPNKNQCKGCHSTGEVLLPIGIAARHLNTNFPYKQGPQNQLSHWMEKDILDKLPSGMIPRNSKWDDEKDGSLDDRARAYLDINCGHCHNPKGAANTSGLYLDIHTIQPNLYGVMKTPVAAGRGSGNFQFDIVPGKPDQSILYYRMNTNDPGIAMPEIGREQIHQEGLALIREWIKKMNP